MGGVQFPGRPALLGIVRRAVDASDWRSRTRRLRAWWLRTRAGRLRPAIRSIWRPAVHWRFWIQRRMGRAAPGVGPAAPAFAAGRKRGGTATGAGPASDPGP